MVKKIKDLIKKDISQINKERLTYVSIFILLIGNFLLLVGLSNLGARTVKIQGDLAQSQIKIAKILGIVADRQMNPLFQVEKENFKNKGKDNEGTHYLPRK